MNKLIYALILTVLPISELRGGLPLAASYSLEKNIPVLLIFLIVIILNILLIFFVFFFLDNLHHLFMKMKIYRKVFEKVLRKFQRRVDKFEMKHEKTEFWALVLFVAIPLPGTGAWSGCLLSWILGLDRKKSILAISLGVVIAGIIILGLSLIGAGIIKLF